MQNSFSARDRVNPSAHQRGGYPAMDRANQRQQATPAKVPVVQCPNLLPVRTGSLLALATIQIGGVQIHKCRLIQQEGQKPFFTPPQESWTDSEGQKRYKTLVELPKAWHPAILDALLAKWQEVLAENGEGA